MKYLIILLVLFSMEAHSQENFPEKYRWKNRLIYLFTTSEENVKLDEQMQILQQDKQGLEDRDLRVFQFLPNDVLDIDSQSKVKTDPAKFRDKYNVDQDKFTFILIGKDGTEKSRSLKPVTLEKLFSTIDAMPMRQREMTEGK